MIRNVKSNYTYNFDGEVMLYKTSPTSKLAPINSKSKLKIKE